MHFSPTFGRSDSPHSHPRPRRLVAAGAAVALAAGLAVAVAPVASAWQEPNLSGFSGSAADLTDIVRIEPAADGTQQAPVLTAGVARSVPSLQIKLPIRTEATASVPGKQYATWQPGDVLTVTLPSGVTFASTPSVSSTELVDLADDALPELAGTLTADGGGAVTLKAPQPQVSLSQNGSVAKLLFPDSQWQGLSGAAGSAEWLNLTSASFEPTDGSALAAGAQPGFLLTLSGLRLTIAASAAGTVTATVAGEASNGFFGQPEYATYPAQAPAACTVGAVGGTRMVSFFGGTTTLGFLPPLAVAVTQPAGQVLSASSDLQQLPPVTFTGRFNAGASYVVAGEVLSRPGGASLGSVLFDFPSHSPRIPYMDAEVTTSGAVQGVSLIPSAGQYGTVRTAQLTLTAATGGAGSVNVAGLRIAGYVPEGSAGATAIPAGASLRLTISASSTAGGASGGLAVNDAATVGCLTKPGASSFSAVTEPADGGGDAFVGAASLVVASSANRIGGLNRFDTAGRLAQAYASTPGVAQPRYVIIANGENRKGGFDALSANYLAGRVGAPILLTFADTLPRESALALRAILAGSSSPVTLYVMGQSDSVSDAVVGSLTAIARSATSAPVTVSRIAGKNRFATSAAAASIGAAGSVSFAKGSPAAKTAIVASGLVNADALAAGPLSFSLGLPVLLTGEGDTLPPEVAAVIKKQGITQVFALGGVERVSAKQVAQLRALGVTVLKRIAGGNRFATSAELYGFATRANSTAAADGGGLGWQAGPRVFVANGMTGFPDALAVGPLAGAGRSVLVTTSTGSLDPSVAALLRSLGRTVVALGQPSTVPDLVYSRR